MFDLSKPSPLYPIAFIAIPGRHSTAEACRSVAETWQAELVDQKQALSGVEDGKHDRFDVQIFDHSDKGVAFIRSKNRNTMWLGTLIFMSNIHTSAAQALAEQYPDIFVQVWSWAPHVQGKVVFVDGNWPHRENIAGIVTPG